MCLFNWIDTLVFNYIVYEPSKNKPFARGLPYIDLAIGARVMITKKLATQIGIYNSATGIVVGFGFHTAIQEEFFPKINSFHSLKNRELPIVFVKMDKYTGIQISPDVDKQALIHLQNVLMKNH